jgi:hypothetical protein
LEPLRVPSETWGGTAGLCWSSPRRAALLDLKVTECESLDGSAAAALVLLANASLLVQDDFCKRRGHVQRKMARRGRFSMCYKCRVQEGASPMRSSGPRRGSVPLLQRSFVAGIARLLANIDACKRRGRVQRSTARCGRQRPLDRLGFRPVPQWRPRAGKVAAALVVW